MVTAQHGAVVSACPRTIRVGSISYLNTKPLVFGLDRDSSDISLLLDVPSRLLDGLRNDRFDVALMPVIDYQRMAGLRVLTAAGIGCEGPTLTVRIFSRVPIPRIRTMACDSDSHSSVALARIILADAYGIRPRFNEWSTCRATPAEAKLLIGDKVVCDEPPGFEHQLDLGAAWNKLTGLPFVFALWMARAGVDLGTLPRRLEHAKREGLAHVDEIIAKHAVPRGWPAGVALQYLTCYLKYDVGEPQLKAVALFHELAHRHGILPDPPRPLEIYPA